MTTQKPLRELRKCLGCPKYFWTLSLSTEAGTDNWSERLKYCSDCWNNRMQRAMSLEEIEARDKEMPEEQKQAEENGERYRRYRVN